MKAINTLYRHFDNLFGIEAIDKFVAKEFGFIDELEQEEQFIWADLSVFAVLQQWPAVLF